MGEARPRQRQDEAPDPPIGRRMRPDSDPRGASRKHDMCRLARLTSPGRVLTQRSARSRNSLSRCFPGSTSARPNGPQCPATNAAPRLPVHGDEPGHRARPPPLGVPALADLRRNHKGCLAIHTPRAVRWGTMGGPWNHPPITSPTKGNRRDFLAGPSWDGPCPA